MKKLPILSMIVLFVMTFNHLSGQSVVKKELKSEIKNEKEDVKKEKKVIKTERVALHKLEGKEVSMASKNAFYVDFGDLKNVTWKRTSYFDEATFIKDGKEVKAYYDLNSKLVGTSSFAKFADLPQNAQKEIKEKYKDYSIGDVVFFDDNEANETDMLLYDVQFEDEDNYFVKLSKSNKSIVVQVNPRGEIFFFKEL
jgi:hypothetical protein